MRCRACRLLPANSGRCANTPTTRGAAWSCRSRAVFARRLRRRAAGLHWRAVGSATRRVQRRGAKLARGSERNLGDLRRHQLRQLPRGELGLAGAEPARHVAANLFRPALATGRWRRPGVSRALRRSRLSRPIVSSGARVTRVVGGHEPRGKRARQRRLLGAVRSVVLRRSMRGGLRKCPGPLINRPGKPRRIGTARAHAALTRPKLGNHS